MTVIYPEWNRKAAAFVRYDSARRRALTPPQPRHPR
jgi:hypothetical protein